MADALGELPVKGHLFNLIVYTYEKRRSEYFHKKIDELLKTFPARVIFIESADEKSKEGLRVEADENDQVRIQASSSQLSQVPYAILPYLVPDLPVYLIWGGNPAGNGTLEHLQQIATRLVFDADTSENLQDFSRKMLAKIETLSIEYMDLDWAKMGGWRDVIHQTFASSKKFEELKQCSRLTIKYNSSNDPLVRHAAIQAIYLQGWLAAQLSWVVKTLGYDDQGAIRLLYENGSQPLEVQLLPQGRATLTQGRIFEVEFQTKEGLDTTLVLAEKQSKVMVYFATSERCELPFSLQIPDLQKGLTAVKEMFYYLPTPHYRNMLAMISQIAWKRF